MLIGRDASVGSVSMPTSKNFKQDDGSIYQQMKSQAIGKIYVQKYKEKNPFAEIDEYLSIQEPAESSD